MTLDLCRYPRVYVSALLAVHSKYSTLVESSFSSDTGLLTALDKVRRAAIIMAVSRSTYNNNSIELV